MSSTAAANGEETSLNKTESTSSPSLPDDLVVSCLARVSRLYYPTLSLVSKSFRSFIASPEIYKTRSLLGRTESCLYVCLQFPHDLNPRWFTLSRKPDRTLTYHTSKKKEKEWSNAQRRSGKFLVPISTLNAPPVEWSNLVGVGHNIYAICGHIVEPPCSNVSFLDCRTHTWLEAPSLRLALADTGVDLDLDGKMYLAGSSENPESLNCIEVFNTNTQTWDRVLPQKQTSVLRNKEGNIYMNMNGGSGKMRVSFMSKEFAWEQVGLDTNLDEVSMCMIENVTYCYKPSCELNWFQTTVGGGRFWRKVKGLEGLLKFGHYSTVKLANHGGKMAVFWEKYVPTTSGYKVCAEISLEKRSSEEIRGKVEWLDAVLTVPKSYKFVYAIAATL